MFQQVAAVSPYTPTEAFQCHTAHDKREDVANPIFPDSSASFRSGTSFRIAIWSPVDVATCISLIRRRILSEIRIKKLMIATLFIWLAPTANAANDA